MKVKNRLGKMLLKDRFLNSLEAESESIFIMEELMI